MVWLLGSMVVILIIIVIVQAVKIYFLKRATCEITEGFAEHLATDTNTLIDVSTRDKHMLQLAGDINNQLRLLRKQRQQFLNGDRELKEAVTNISHDLRTPLTAICGYLDLLEREEKTDTVARYLSFIENRTQALKLLTEELFRYSVILCTDQELEKEPVSINGVLEESVVAFYGALKERGIVPDIKMPETSVVRELNKDALSRVFSNILNNALKYSAGDLEIEMTEAGEIIFTNTASNLDEVQVGKLFDRFFTVEAARNSTGLGLAIAKTLVEQMNGRIEARYERGRLRICITL